MPSAATVKIDKQINSENSLSDSCSNLTPLRQAITIIEHKIRNLEKRKSKLESYKELQNAGKELNADQKTAVAKFNEVINTLDFARDLCKQFLGIASVTEKEAKKLAKKEAAAKYQAELARLREILLVQDALNQMGNDNVREDFLHGRNSAAQLSESDLKLLDDLYPAVTPKHEAGNPTAFTNEVQAAAEHLLSTVDGKSKEVFGGTYSQIKEVLGKIHESGYFDQAQVFESYVEGEVTAEPEQAVEEDNHIPNSSPEPECPEVINEKFEYDIHVARSPVQFPLNYYSHEDEPPYEAPIVMPPEPESPKPIAEVLGTGSFFFLQESEIDPPEQIPSQTFTNQNFNTHVVQPVPLPPTHFTPMPNNLPPANYQVSPPVTNSGFEENLGQPEEQNLLKDLPPAVNQEPPGSSNNQSYYQNNNNCYNNRPRHQNQTRNNGPRPATTNRHN